MRLVIPYGTKYCKHTCILKKLIDNLKLYTTYVLVPYSQNGEVSGGFFTVPKYGTGNLNSRLLHHYFKNDLLEYLIKRIHASFLNTLHIM